MQVEAGQKVRITEGGFAGQTGCVIRKERTIRESTKGRVPNDHPQWLVRVYGWSAPSICNESELEPIGV